MVDMFEHSSRIGMKPMLINLRIALLLSGLCLYCVVLMLADHSKFESSDDNNKKCLVWE